MTEHKVYKVSPKEEIKALQEENNELRDALESIYFQACNLGQELERLDYKGTHVSVLPDWEELKETTKILYRRTNNG